MRKDLNPATFRQKNHENMYGKDEQKKTESEIEIIKAQRTRRTPLVDSAAVRRGSSEKRSGYHKMQGRKGGKGEKSS
jgi:hypothetical protein